MCRLGSPVGMVALLGLAMMVGGCASGSNSLLQNPNKDLRKHRKEFVADAATRSYPTTAQSVATSPIRGEVDYQIDVINLVNLSDTEWKDVEVWVNGRYVCSLTTLPAKKQVGINFGSLFDNQGLAAPQQGVWVEKVEVLYNGSLRKATMHPAD